MQPESGSEVVTEFKAGDKVFVEAEIEDVLECDGVPAGFWLIFKGAGNDMLYFSGTTAFASPTGLLARLAEAEKENAELRNQIAEDNGMIRRVAKLQQEKRHAQSLLNGLGLMDDGKAKNR